MGSFDRRGFLKALASATAAAAAGSYIDPDFLVWRPGAKRIFIPTTPAIKVAAVELATPEQVALTNLVINRKSGKSGTVADFSGNPYFTLRTGSLRLTARESDIKQMLGVDQLSGPAFEAQRQRLTRVLFAEQNPEATARQVLARAVFTPRTQRKD